MGLGGEMAASSMQTVSSGTFKVKLFDCIYNMTGQGVLRGEKIKWL